MLTDGFIDLSLVSLLTLELSVCSEQPFFFIVFSLRKQSF